MAAYFHFSETEGASRNLTSTTRDPELERFKNEIDLRDYAAHQGYAIDRKESWRGSTVMRCAANDDKIIVSRDQDGHYVYFSVRDDSDNGSIIDFVFNHERCSLGQVRMKLRPWIGRKAEAAPVFPPLEKRTQKRLEVDKAFWRMPLAASHPYLIGERCIPPALLASERFMGRVRIDERGNAILPHFDQEGLCGYEIKNRRYTAFSSGGTKGLWFSLTEATDTRLVIAESAIDALSYAALFPSPESRYASTGGKMNPSQPALITAAARRMPTGSTIVAATDNDQSGTELAEDVKLAVQNTQRDDLVFSIHQPEGVGADWNDIIRQCAFGH